MCSPSEESSVMTDRAGEGCAVFPRSDGRPAVEVTMVVQ